MLRENLGNLALRTVLAVTAAAVLALSGFPLLAGLTGGSRAILLAGILVGGCFYLSGRLLDKVARAWIEGRVREAMAWDQAGMEEEARLAFDKAMAVLDGWIPSPGARKSLGLWLGGRMVRFVMACQDPAAEDVKRASAYLWSCPGDLDTVQAWLNWKAANRSRHDDDQELLELIASRYPDNLNVQKALARAFIKAGRSDSVAVATCQILLQQEDHQARRLATALASIIEHNRRNAQPLGDNLPDRPVLAAGAGTAKDTPKRSRSFPVGLTAATAAAVSGCLGLALFFHGVQNSRPGEKTVTRAVEVERKERFTIQVAAYLKETDAAGWVKQLRLKGYDSFYTPAGKAPKRWYQVKIGRFATKAEAQAFGSGLKKEGIIDDFYVANYKY